MVYIYGVCMGYVMSSSICCTELVSQLFEDRDYENSVAIIFFCNFQITRLLSKFLGNQKKKKSKQQFHEK